MITFNWLSIPKLIRVVIWAWAIIICIQAVVAIVAMLFSIGAMTVALFNMELELGPRSTVED